MTSDIDTWEVLVVDNLDPKILTLVSEFFNENFPGVFPSPCIPEIFNWKLGENNPAGRGLLTVALAKGRVIGTTSATARILNNGERPVLAMEIGDTFTHPDWRKNGICISPAKHLACTDEYFCKSVFGRLVLETIYRAKINGHSLIYGTPNSNSYPPYIKRLKFQELNQGDVFNQQSIGKDYGRTISFVRVYGKASYSFFKMRNKTRKNPIKIVEYIGNEVELPLFDDSGGKRTGLVMKSDLEWIKHRYIDHPNNNYRFFTVNTGKNIQGFIVATTLVRPSGFRTLLVSEFWSEHTNFSKYLKEISILLQGDFSNIELISFWSISKKKGSFLSKNIKIIALNLSPVAEVHQSGFRKFHMGWSDNG